MLLEYNSICNNELSDFWAAEEVSSADCNLTVSHAPSKFKREPPCFELQLYAPDHLTVKSKEVDLLT